eukprot:TRINITY_DN2730_c1_g1_i3.p2 TRINITY_DN2730_c1_g1~~TRINITY_DN2730_c1_g1_i3.p2  ORF type:complete len:231 (+),score=-15.10 TRINITY_DN2730_c1_g1_i3:363-1055(+)
MQRQPQYTRPSVMSSQPKAINVQKHSVFHPHQCSQFKSKHQNTTANKKKQRQTFKTKPLYFTNISKQLKNLSLSLDLDNLATVQTQKNPDRHLLRFNVVRSNKQTNEHTLYTRYTFLYLETINITQYNKLRQTTFFTQNKTNWQKLPLRVFQSHVETFSQQTILQAQSTKAPQPDQPHINYSPQDILEGHGLQSNSNSNKCPKCLQIQTKPKKHFQTYFEWQQNITIFLQ